MIVILSDQRTFDKNEIEDLSQQNRKLREELEKMESLNEVTQPLGMEDSNSKFQA